MSRKHYTATAKIIADQIAFANGIGDGSGKSSSVNYANGQIAAACHIAQRLADEFAADNRSFDRARFYAACTLQIDGTYED